MACKTDDVLEALFTAKTELQLTASCQESTQNNSTTIRFDRLDTGSAGNVAITQNSFTSRPWVGEILGLAGGSDVVTDSEPRLVERDYILSGSHGFLPYVPPYLDPATSGWAKISFTANDGTRQYSLQEVLSDAEITYRNIQEPSNPDTNCNYQNSMCISASLNLTDTVQLLSDNLNVTDSDDLRSRWLIRTKWETPVLDFTNAKATALDLSSSTVTEVTGSPWKNRYQSNYYQILIL